MKLTAIVLLMAGLVACGDEPKADDVKKEVEKLQGTWTISKIERDGEDLTEQIGGAEVEIEGEKYTAPNIAASFKLDPSKSPKSIDLSYTEGPAAGKTIKAIYKLEGETLTICRAMSAESECPDRVRRRRGLEQDAVRDEAKVGARERFKCSARVSAPPSRAPAGGLPGCACRIPARRSLAARRNAGDHR